MRNFKRCTLIAGLLVSLLVTATPLRAQAPEPQTTETTPMQRDGVADYVLGVGDKLRVTVFGEAGLSGDFEISSTGIMSMPLIGDVKAAGDTVSTFRASVTHKLADGYMKNPNVSVEVLNYRPFFILGEVTKPGSYNYVNGMTVINAVALAAGYTYRADKDGITIKHNATDAKPEKANETSIVLPGDVVNVPERFF